MAVLIDVDCMILLLEFVVLAGTTHLVCFEIIVVVRAAPIRMGGIPLACIATVILRAIVSVLTSIRVEGLSFLLFGFSLNIVRLILSVLLNDDLTSTAHLTCDEIVIVEVSTQSWDVLVVAAAVALRVLRIVSGVFAPTAAVAAQIRCDEVAIIELAT